MDEQPNRCARQGRRATGSRKPTIAERRAARAAVDDPQAVLDAALRFLEARSRSVAEVRRRLTSAGYRADLVGGAIDRLLELGMLDDEAFARAWVGSRDRARPRGESALRRELGLKGVARETLDRVLEERREESASVSDTPLGADEAAAERLVARHRAALQRVADPRKRRQRAYALLARNGFDPEICSRLAGLVGDGAEVEAPWTNGGGPPAEADEPPR
jgi:regulatory protein